MPWMLLSNHGHVLLYVDTYPDARLREIAAAIGITERRAQDHDRPRGGGLYLARRVGRRNRYEVHRGVALRHARVVGRSVGDLLHGLEPVGFPDQSWPRGIPS